MQIQKLEIASFRGAKNVAYDFGQKLNVFQGSNGLGKTTLIDSIMWCLTGETIVYGKQDKDNRNKHNLDDKLSVAITFDNGIVLERNYFDVWVEDDEGNKKYSRTENQYKINGAKYKQEEYYDFIKTEIGLNKIIKTKDYNILRGIVDYKYFSSIDYKVARKFIEELMGLKTDDELLNDNQFSLIRMDMKLQKYDINKCTSKYVAAYKDVDKEINKLVVDLENKKKSSGDFDENLYIKLYNERNEVQATIPNNEEEYIRISGLIENCDKEYSERIKNDMQEYNDADKKMNEIVVIGNNCNAENKTLKLKVGYLSNDIVQLKSEIESLEKNIELETNKTFGAVKCPNCGVVLNNGEIESFEKAKSQKIESLKENIETRKSLIKSKENDVAALEQKILENTQKIENIRPDYFKAKNDYLALAEKIKNNNIAEEVSLKKNNYKNQLNEFIATFSNNKNVILNELNSKIGELIVKKNANSEIAVIEAKLSELKKQRATFELQKQLVKDFKDIKMKMIKENTDKVFPDIEFELQEESNTTGVISDCCYAKLKDVEFLGVNDGYRYLLGIKMIENIKRVLGLQDLPIIFDKFADVDSNTLSEICKLTNSQIISTSVNNDKEIILYKGEN